MIATATRPTAAAADDRTNPFLVNAGTSGRGIVGRLSEARIYTRALTALEVQERFLAGLAGTPGGLPRPFSPLPQITIDGEVCGARTRRMLGRINRQPIIEHGAHKTTGWHNNSRDVNFDLDQVADVERELLPLPLWSFVFGEGFADGTALRAASGLGLPAGALVGDLAWTWGPFNAGRARSFPGDTAHYLALDSTFSSIVQGLSSITILAWARLGSLAAVERGLVYLGIPITMSVNASHQLQFHSQVSSVDGHVDWTSAAAIADTDRFHLIGGGVDFTGTVFGSPGKVCTFVDDAGLASVPVGSYEIGGFSTGYNHRFSGESPSDCAIGLSATGHTTPWLGDIATVALYPGLLSAAAVNAIWRAGRRGVFR